jgi:hypothetical protein
LIQDTYSTYILHLPTPTVYTISNRKVVQPPSQVLTLRGSVTRPKAANAPAPFSPACLQTSSRFASPKKHNSTVHQSTTTTCCCQSEFRSRYFETKKPSTIDNRQSTIDSRQSHITASFARRRLFAVAHWHRRPSTLIHLLFTLPSLIEPFGPLSPSLASTESSRATRLPADHGRYPRSTNATFV